VAVPAKKIAYEAVYIVATIGYPLFVILTVPEPWVLVHIPIYYAIASALVWVKLSEKEND
jgi:hypothetical protein